MAGSRPEYDVLVVQDVMTPMRDGVGLAADIYLPARGGEPAPGKFPALLERTPYNKKDPERVVQNGEYYARHGYAVVIQDVRGRFRSEGEFSFLVNEPQDGYDTVEWIAAQPWCSGAVGTLGTSYMGWTQSALATQNPPHLRAMFVNQSGSNAYTSSLRHGGAFELRFLCWAFWGGAVSKEALADPVVGRALGRVNVREWLTRLPIRRGCSPLALIPAYERWALDLMTRGDYDDFWKQPGLNIEAHYKEHADVPTYYSGGWYDSYTRATLENFVGLSAIKKQPIHVIMGPWTHGWKSLGLSYAGDVEFGSEAAIDYNAFRLRFFDHFVKGLPGDLGDEAPVRIFVMGGGDGRRTGEGRMRHGGRWRTEQEWPLARTRYTPFYLHPDGGLGPSRPPAGAAATRYLYDPRNPVPTIGGNMSSLAGLMPRPEGAPEIPNTQREREMIGLPGAFDQREAPEFFGCRPPYLPLASRPDVLVFQSEPLADDTEVTGPLVVTLWGSSSAPDTDFTAKLIDVYPPNLDYPDGYAMNLTDTILRARYRNGDGAAELLRPGEVTRFTLPLYPTSNLFQRGHRIRLDISSSNFPRFDVNPNTGEPVGAHRMWAVAENAVYHDAAHPSHVTLPIIQA
jgi:putative CocE/NonD family hydrolase